MCEICFFELYNVCGRARARACVRLKTALVRFESIIWRRFVVVAILLVCFLFVCFWRVVGARGGVGGGGEAKRFCFPPKSSLLSSSRKSDIKVAEMKCVSIVGTPQACRLCLIVGSPILRLHHWAC